MLKMLKPVLRHWPVLALIASAAMLATAHAFQTFGGFAPCTACYWQRNVYWVAMAVAALGVAADMVPPGRRLRPWFAAALAATFLVGCWIAIYHSGAEWKWWPGPQECSGGGAGASAAGLARLMQGAKVIAPRCDQAAWRMLGLSMAGWNALVSLGLAGLSALSWKRGDD
jgi:disulfide bond formation protein DsbB